MLDLSTPSAKSMRDFNNNPDALKAAISAIRALQDLVRIVTPHTIAMIAQQQFPGQPLAMAIANLEIEITQAHTELSGHAEQTRAAQDAERERLAPVRGFAVRRTFAIQDRLEQIGREIPRAENDAEARRVKLAEAGVKQEEIDRLVPAFDISGLLAERDELQDELDSLNRFITTGDDSHLPEGFTVTPILKVEFPLEKRAA